MKLYTAALLKNEYTVLMSYGKERHIGARHLRVTGKAVQVVFNEQTTRFEVSDFVKTSKKQRSNIVDIQIKDILHYNFIGLCIAHKKDPYGFNTSFTIRNVFSRVPVELVVMLFSPVIDRVSIYTDIKKLRRITHNKYYFLRKKPMPQSVINFEYVTDITEDEITPRRS